MYTYEMIALADENGRTYKSEYGTYNKEEGFNFNTNAFEHILFVELESFVSELFHENLWKLDDEPKVRNVSLEELERELGYRIKIVDPEPEKHEVSPERKKEVDDAIDFFERLFGTNHNINREDYY